MYIYVLYASGVAVVEKDSNSLHCLACSLANLIHTLYPSSHPHDVQISGKDCRLYPLDPHCSYVLLPAKPHACTLKVII